MKKITFKIVAIISLMFSVVYGYATECKVKFVAKSLDYVQVQNLTKGTSVIINVTTNDSLRLTDQKGTAVQEVKDANMNIRVLYNANGTHELNFYAKQNGNTQVNVLSMDGKRISSVNQNLNIGNNAFQLTLPLGMFVIQVIGNGFTYSTKAVNSTNLQFPSITYKGGNATGIKSPIQNAKKTTQSNKIVYLYCQNGDNILFKGVSENYSTMINGTLNDNFWNSWYTMGWSCYFDFPASCVDADANIYSVVPIGSQVWMAENLRTTKYRNSTSINNISTLFDWANNTTGAWNHNANDTNNDNGAKFGHLYNWYAVNNGNNLAPEGWHIPSNSEWKRMNDYLISIGKKGINLKSTIDWTTVAGDNFFAYNSYPVGSLSNTAGYITQNEQVNYWTSTAVNASNAWSWLLNSTTDSLEKVNSSIKMGYAIRCVKDTTIAIVNTTTAIQKYGNIKAAGSVSNFGGTPLKECGICYSTFSSPTINDLKIVSGTNILGGSIWFGYQKAYYDFNAQIFNINTSLTYYMRAYAINGCGIAYGEEVAVIGQPINQDSIFTKIYSTLGLTGNQQPAGDADILGIDEGFSAFVRLIWNLNELTTDEALCSWGDPGIPEMNYNKWSSSHNQLNGLYKRLYYNINLCNFFINQIAWKTDATSIKQRAEARFMRALNYYYLLDMFGNVPIPESSITQATRTQLYNYLQTELAECEPDMYAPTDSKEYYRVNKVANWLLRSRLYLNAEVYTGTAHWDEAAIYAKMVIDPSSGYSLCPTYRQLFMADNAGVLDGSTVNQAANEIILPINVDGKLAKSWGNSLFLIASTHIFDMPNWGTTEGWGGNRARAALVKKFFPTGTTYFTDPNDLTTTLASSPLKDNRALFFIGKYIKSVVTGRDSLYPRTLNIQSNNFTQGYSVIKYNNLRADGGKTSDTQFPDTDVPFMRAAEAYLNYAEAVLRGGAKIGGYEPLDAVNALRTRASAKVYTALTLQNIIDERAKEFFFEGYRRSDLIRFGQYGGNGTGYTWDWKGGIAAGTDFSIVYNIFPIPASELNANPNLIQNPGY